MDGHRKSPHRANRGIVLQCDAAVNLPFLAYETVNFNLQNAVLTCNNDPRVM